MAEIDIQELYKTKSMQKMLKKVLNNKIEERLIASSKPRQIQTPLGAWKKLVEHGFFHAPWRYEHGIWKRQEKNVPWYPIKEQWQWFHWALEQRGHFMFMGARKIGKTELLTIFQAVWLIYNDPKYKIIILTGTETRGKYLVGNIKDMLLALGVQFRKNEVKSAFTVANLEKTATISTRGTVSKLKGDHVNLIIIDDPLDESEGFSRVKVDNIKDKINEAKSMADRVMMIGQYVHEEDIFRLYEGKIPTLTAWQPQYPHLVRMTKESFCQGKDAKSLRSWGMNYEGVFYPADEAIFHNIGLTKLQPTGRIYAVIDPARGGKDRTAMAIGGLVYDPQIKEEILVAWLYSWQSHYNAVMREIIHFIQKHQVDYVYYEGTENILIEDRLADARIRSDAIVTTQNKVLKIMTLKGYVALGLIKIHEDTRDGDLQLLRLWNELSRHDDVPDALAMLAKQVFTGL